MDAAVDKLLRLFKRDFIDGWYQWLLPLTNEDSGDHHRHHHNHDNDNDNDDNDDNRGVNADMLDELRRIINQLRAVEWDQTALLLIQIPQLLSRHMQSAHGPATGNNSGITQFVSTVLELTAAHGTLTHAMLAEIVTHVTDTVVARVAQEEYLLQLVIAVERNMPHVTKKQADWRQWLLMLFLLPTQSPVVDNHGVSGSGSSYGDQQLDYYALVLVRDLYDVEERHPAWCCFGWLLVRPVAWLVFGRQMTQLLRAATTQLVGGAMATKAVTLLTDTLWPHGARWSHAEPVAVADIQSLRTEACEALTRLLQKLAPVVLDGHDVAARKIMRVLADRDAVTAIIDDAVALLHRAMFPRGAAATTAPLPTPTARAKMMTDE